jgi:hypothetical protein
MIRLLTIACLCAAGLQVAIWSGLVAGWSTWTTLVGSPLGEAATKLERATEPRSALTSSALTSPADSLSRDVAAAREEIRKLEEAWRQTSAAEQQLLAQEGARAEALDRLAEARQEIQTLKVDQANAAQEAAAAERTRAQERAQGDAPAGNLAAVCEENRTTVRADTAADNTSAPQPEFPRNGNDENALDNSNDPGPTGHAMAVAVASDNMVAAAHQSDTPSGTEPVPALALAETYDAHMIPADAIHHLDPNEIASSLRRGDALIASGDLAAARLVLRRAADAGDARAAMTLAETYDPAILEKQGVHGIVPDLAMARGWYEKAKKFGAVEAAQRLELLASKQH